MAKQGLSSPLVNINIHFSLATGGVHREFDTELRLSSVETNLLPRGSLYDDDRSGARGDVLRGGRPDARILQRESVRRGSP